MSRSIAGAKYTGHFADKYTAISRLSQFPLAIFESVLAVAGQIRIKSAQIPRSTWLFHVSSSSSEVKLEYTGFLDNVESVKGVMNSLASGVITTFTSAPFLINNLTSIAVL